MIKLLGIGLTAFLLLLLEQKLYQKLWKKGLSIRVCFTKDSLFEGEDGTLQEVVENRKKLPLSMLNVKFQTHRNLIFEETCGSRTTDRYYRNDVFQIGGREKITRTITFTGGRRGFYAIDKVDLVAADLFLTSNTMDTADVNTSVYVYPKPFGSDEFRRSLKQLNGEVLTRRHLLEDPFEYRGIREYQPFDDMHSINWKATARTGDLKVNQKNYTSLQSVRIFLNLEDAGILKKTECVEAAIRIGAGLCEHFLKEGIQTACYGNAEDALSGTLLCMEAGAGQGHMTAIYRALACMDTGKVQPFTAHFKDKLLQEAGGTFTCFVSPNQYTDFIRLVEEYQQTGQDYIWFYPVEGSKDPKLPQSLAAHIRLIHLDRDI